MNRKISKRILSLGLTLALLLGNFPALSFAAQTGETTERNSAVASEQREPDCTGLADCGAESHHDSCESVHSHDKAAEKDSAADAVMELIKALPTLENIQAKPVEDQGRDYEQVQAAYAAYCALPDDQQALLPPPEEVFKPYFDYFNSMVSEVWSGSGTSGNPYLIYTERDLRDLAQRVNSGNKYSGVYFRLANNITLTGDWTPIGTESSMFCGTFDGNGKTISGMTITGSHAGLFAYVGSGATIKNVNMREFSVTGASYLAGLVVHAEAGTGTITIADCTVSGSLQDNDETYPDGYLAGIVAYANAESGTITISGCTSNGSYSCDYYTGGIVGYGKGNSHSLKIRNCTNNALIYLGNNGDACGGIAGAVYSAELESCFNYADISGNAYSEDNGTSWLGGISGVGGGCNFNGCANYGEISCFFPGGITASQNSGNVANSCLNAGKLTHSSDGHGHAILYIYQQNTAVNCYYRYGTGMAGAEAVGASQLASGEIAHAMRDYFGQTIGVDQWPVPLTATNRVYRVTVVGEVSRTFYVNYGQTAALPELSSCAAYYIDDTKFDPSTPITRDYVLAAKGDHNYADGTCIYCGSTGVGYVDAGACGDSAGWVLSTDGVLTISGSGAMKNFSESNPAPWKVYASKIQSVRVEDGVTNVGDYAFDGLTEVTAFTLSDTVTSIGNYAFNGLTKLTEISIHDFITSIGDYAFASCTGATRLTLSDRLVTIGDYAFYWCEGLRSVSIPGAVKTIGNGAFRDCKAMDYIWLTNGLNSIGAYAFAETAIESLSIPATVTQIGDHAFANCAGLVDVTFMGAAPEIAAAAFTGDTAVCHTPAYDSSWDSKIHQNYGGNLTWDIGSGTCGNSVNWVLNYDRELVISGSGAMYDYSYSSNPWQSLQEQIHSVIVCDGVTSIGDYAFYECTKLSSVSIADSVTAIGDEYSYGYSCTFLNCTSLTQITIPKNVKTIGYDVFADCTSLTSIEVAAGNTAFSSANGILYDQYKDTLRCYPAGKTGAFTIPSSVDTIAPFAFSDNGSLEEITIPYTVTSIGRYAFEDCTGLTHITFEGSAPTIDSSAFSDVKATVDVPLSNTTWTADKMKDYGGTLSWNAGSGSCGTNVRWDLVYLNGSATLTISGTGAMNDYTSGTQPWKDHLSSIRTVEVCDGVTYVGAYALCMGTSSQASTSLTTLKLADSVTSIGNDAFTFCTKLSNVTWSKNLRTIGESAFVDTALTSIEFPDSLRIIGRFAFEYCRSLKSVTFGSGLQSIGYTAFAGCTALQTVDLGDTVTTLEQSAFNGCTSLTKITIPKSVTSVGKWAFRNCTNLQYVEFEGSAPTFDANAFAGAACNAYYHSSQSGWTSSKLANYGGTLTWGAISQRGSCGSKAEWILDTNGNLFICGSGYMSAYSETNRAPWYDYRTSIKMVSFRGVTSVGAYAFADCPELQLVMFDGYAPSFGTNSFSGTTCEIWYPSTASGWSSSIRKDYGGSLTWRSTTNRGTCGTSAKWALDSNGTLVILGSGAMTNYSSTNQPWYSSNSAITSVVIGGKVTSVGNYAFRGCTALQTVTIGDSVTSVNNYAFSNCSALQSITFQGKAPSIASYAFNGISATAYYPITNTSWTSSVKKNYGGTITWMALCLNHVETVAPAVDPTCTTTGLTEGSYCSLCNEILVEQKLIPAKGHYAMGPDQIEVPADTLEADCVNAIICTVCGGVAKEALGHRVSGTVKVEKDPLKITNTSYYPFTLTNGTYYSTNTGNSSTSELLITALYDCSLTLNYGVSSEEDYDKLYIYQNGSTKSTISGEEANRTLTLALKAGDVVKVCYKKDSSQKSGQDRGWVALVYDHVMVDSVGDVPADTAEPDCTNAVVCKYCQTVVKEALGHRVIIQQPVPENPFTVTNASAVPFELRGDKYYSNNHTSSSTSTIQFNVHSDGKLTLNYGVSSEPSYDKLIVLVNGVTRDTISGVVSAKTMTLSVKAGDTISVRYSKDGSANRNDDNGWVSVQYEQEAAQEIVPADSVEADCNGVVCDFCQVVVKEALGHTEVIDEAVAPDCENTGLTEGKHCSKCNEVLTPQTVVEALGHTFGDWSVAQDATCSENGEERRTCQTCGHIENRAIDATGHDYDAVVTAPTCTEQGFTTHTCSKCGDSYADSYVVATGHNYQTTVTDPTCTEKGFTSHVCHCGDTYIDNYVDALGHYVLRPGKKPVDAYTLHNSTTYPFTLSNGWYSSTNKRDSSSSTFQIRISYDCTMVLNYKVSSESTYDKLQILVNNSLKKTASGEVSESALTLSLKAGDIVNIRYTKDSSASRGADTGYFKIQSCTKGEQDAIVQVPAEEVEPTCTEAVICERCKQTIKEALGHREVIDEAVEPGCETTGLTEGKHCSVCEEILASQNTIPATGHSFGDWIVEKAATCVDKGTERRECENCDHFETREVEAIGHDYKAVVTEPTCTERGYTTHTCSNCGDSYVDTYIDALGHAYGEWETVKEATYEEDGEERRECSRCGDEQKRIIPMLTHSYESVVTAPTCTEKGYTTHTCSDCGDSYKDTYVDALGHSFKDYVSDSNATCTADGTKTAKCERCEATDTVTDVGTAKGHSFGDWTVTTKPTCTETGEEQRKCADCGHYENRETEAAGHDHKAVITDPTCTEKGFTTHTCSNCGDSYVDTYIDALGHDYGDWETVKEATYEEDGEERRECSRCGDEQKRIIPMLTHSYESVVTAPTCTEKGYTTHTCTDCGDSYKDTYVDALGHSFKDYVSNNDATCTADGTKTAKCERCEAADTVTDVGTAKGHSFGDWIVEKEATCVDKGTERRECANCDHFETRVIEATGHDYKAVVTEPTCTEQGYTTHTCSKCNDTYKDSYVEAAGHSFGDWVVTTEPTCTETGEEQRKCANCDHSETRETEAAGHDYEVTVTEPTCTAQGYTTHTCTECGDTYKDSFVDALGHDYGDWETTKEATCETDGEECRICGRCQTVETNALEAIGHDYEEVVTIPTCMDKGFTTHTCSNCGDKYEDSYVDALGHALGEWQQTKDPTCTAAGEERKLCENCDYFESREVEAIGHDHKAVVTEPTCTERGYTTHTCSNCGDSYVDTYIDALGHDYGDWEVVKEATYEEDGEERRECSRCGDEQKRILPMLTHSYESVVTAPTCTEKGYTTHTCSDCGDSYVDTYIDALGHSFKDYVSDNNATCTADGTKTAKCERCDTTDTVTDAGTAKGHALSDWTVVTQPTCTQKGMERRDCANCDHSESRELAATGHEYEAVITAPTCEAKGYTTHSCTKCEESYVDSYVDAIGHDYSDWQQTKAPGCEETGEETRECANCGNAEKRILDATGHDFEATVTAPTCEEKGYTTHTCANCGDSHVDSYVDALGHNFEDGTCSNCGEPEIKYLPGDVDLDGDVDVDDVLALLWYVLFPEDYPINAAADFDDNGTVDVDDVLTLLWHVLFPEDYPLN